METITIPSPTAFLASSPVLSPQKLLSPTAVAAEPKSPPLLTTTTAKAQKRKSTDSKPVADERESKAARETKPAKEGRDPRDPNDGRDGRDGSTAVGKKGASTPALGNGVTKPKQSKSRNGMLHLNPLFLFWLRLQARLGGPGNGMGGHLPQWC